MLVKPRLLQTKWPFIWLHSDSQQAAHLPAQQFSSKNITLERDNDDDDDDDDDKPPKGCFKVKSRWVERVCRLFWLLIKTLLHTNMQAFHFLIKQVSSAETQLSQSKGHLLYTQQYSIHYCEILNTYMTFTEKYLNCLDRLQ